MAQSTRTARGHITIVQEGRFRMINQEGQGLLLTLGNSVRYGADDLLRLRDAHALVDVDYSGEPNLSTGVARAVREA